MGSGAAVRWETYVVQHSCIDVLVHEERFADGEMRSVGCAMERSPAVDVLSIDGNLREQEGQNPSEKRLELQRLRRLPRRAAPRPSLSASRRERKERDTEVTSTAERQ